MQSLQMALWGAQSQFPAVRGSNGRFDSVNGTFEPGRSCRLIGRHRWDFQIPRICHPRAAVLSRRVRTPVGRNGTARVRFFEFHRVARVRSASGPRPLPFLPTGRRTASRRCAPAHHRRSAPAHAWEERRWWGGSRPSFLLWLCGARPSLHMGDPRSAGRPTDPPFFWPAQPARMEPGCRAKK
eukprot:gene18804-biopygen18995